MPSGAWARGPKGPLEGGAGKGRLQPAARGGPALQQRASCVLPSPEFEPQQEEALYWEPVPAPDTRTPVTGGSSVLFHESPLGSSDSHRLPLFWAHGTRMRTTSCPSKQEKDGPALWVYLVSSCRSRHGPTGHWVAGTVWGHMFMVMVGKYWGSPVTYPYNQTEMWRET